MPTETNTTTEKQVTKPKSEWAERERGCYWLGDNNKMTIHIKNKDGSIIKFIAFPNKFKEAGSRQPDGRIYIDNRDSNPASAPKVTSKPTPKPKVEKAPAPEENQDFI